MAGWYDTMRRRWGYNNIPSNQSNRPAPAAQHPTVEQPAQQPVQENTENQEVTPAKWFEDFYQKNMEQSITPEEQQKRVRGAQAAQAIGHLGNVLSSFSNLVFTDKGAPTQTLPSVPDLNIRSFEDRVAEKRRQYIAGQMAAREQDRKSVLDQFKMQLQQKDDDRKDKLNNARIKELESSDALNKEKEEYQKLVNAGVPAKQAAELAFKKAQTRAQEASAARSMAQAANEGKTVDSVIGSDGNVYTRNSKLTENEAMQIVQSTGLEGDDLSPFMIEEKDFWGNTTKRKTDWFAAAAYALQNGMVDAEELKGRGFKLSGKLNNQSSNDNLPPSKRKQNNDNLPPSMRK